MYERVLIPTDGSEAAEIAAEFGITLAAAFDATVHAIHVVDVWEASYVAGNETTIVDLTERQEAAGEDALRSIAGHASDAGLSSEMHLVEAKPYDGIREYVDEAGIDLIAMATHGHTGIDRVVIGSVTERVVRTSDVPVLTVRETARE
jgi:nucleotide-binding universal stress UspA family protein